MKRYLTVVAWLLVSLSMAAQGSHAQPFYLTQGYLLSLLGYADADDADEKTRKQLTAYEFRTPDGSVNARGGLLSVAVIKQGAVPKEYNDLLRHFFGIQPDAAAGRCVLQPSFPDDWDSCSVHTPYIDYTFRRQGRSVVYDVVQRFERPLTIVVRQQNGAGQYVEATGNSKKRQAVRITMPSRVPEVVLHNDFDNSILPTPGLEEPTFEERFKPQRINAFLTDSIRFDRSPDFMIDNEYIVRGVPFLVPMQGNNIAVVSYPDTLTIPLRSRAQRLWLLLADTPVTRAPHQSKAFVVAHYDDGTADILPLMNPDNWTPLPAGTARRICLPLNPEKKVTEVSIRPLFDDISIGLMGITLQ